MSLFSKGKKKEEAPEKPYCETEEGMRVAEKKPEQLSKRKLQRMKGKRNRKNRGRNRRKYDLQKIR